MVTRLSGARTPQFLTLVRLSVQSNNTAYYVLDPEPAGAIAA